MRVWGVLIILTALSLEGQRPSTPCAIKGQGLLSDAYVDGVIQQINKPDSEQFLVTLSFSWSSEIPFVLRTDGKKFELWKGTAENNIYKTLEAADALCQLPLDPKKAAPLIRMKWQRAELPRATFDQFHQQFTQALATHASIIQSEYEPLITTRSFPLYIHVSGTVITYDNYIEHITVETTDSNDARGKADPLNEWVRTVMKLAEDSVPRNEGSSKN
jgi:hypothetical protein